MARKNAKLSDQLRQAIKDSGMSRYAICKACDIDQGAMSKFMKRCVGLGLETIDRLVKFLDLELVKRPKRKGR